MQRRQSDSGSVTRYGISSDGNPVSIRRINPEKQQNDPTVAKQQSEEGGEKVMRDDKNEKISEKTLYSTVNLIRLGGFIGECIEDALYDLFDESVIEKTLHYCDFGPGFRQVLCAVNEAMKTMYGKYGKICTHEQTETKELSENEISNILIDIYGLNVDYEAAGRDVRADSEFTDWAADQIARLEAKKIHGNEENVLKKHTFPRKVRKALMQLNALDERILYLSGSWNENGKMDAGQIAALPEFSCDVSFIEAVLEAVMKTIKRSGCVYSEIENCFEPDR